MEISLQQLAYDTIKEKIISLVYSPNTIVSEASLLKDLDMSRTPVRESLIKLEHEGFVRILSKRGILINPISMSDITMIFDARIVLEPALMQGYSKFIDKEKLKELRIQMDECDTAERFYQLDKALHPVLCLSGPNYLLTSPLRHVLDQHNRIRRLCAPNERARFINANEEHIRIVDSLLEGNLEKAVKELEEHLRLSKTDALSSVLDYNLPVNSI